MLTFEIVLYVTHRNYLTIFLTDNLNFRNNLVTRLTQKVDGMYFCISDLIFQSDFFL